MTEKTESGVSQAKKHKQTNLPAAKERVLVREILLNPVSRIFRGRFWDGRTRKLSRMYSLKQLKNRVISLFLFYNIKCIHNLKDSWIDDRLSPKKYLKKKTLALATYVCWFIILLVYFHLKK